MNSKELYRRALPVVISGGIKTLVVIVAVVISTIHPQGSNVAIALENPKSYNIGAVLSNNNEAVIFYQAIENITSERNILPAGVALHGVSIPMIPNPIRIAKSVCDKLISVQVYAVIVGRPQGGELSPSSVSYTCGFYNIPVFGISSRDSSLSDKNLHASFLRTVPPYSHQADVWIELLKFLKYNCVVFIHSSDNDGRSTLGRFQTLADNASIKVESFVEYEPGISDIAQELEELTHLFCRVFVLFVNTEDAQAIFKEIGQLNMTSPGHVWFVSEQALLASNRPQGIVGIRLANSSHQEAHIIDSVQVIAAGLKDLYDNENITRAPQDCDNLGRTWDTGLKFASYLKRQTVYGKTGRISFDDKGDRLFSDYEILNWVGDRMVEVGSFSFSKDQNGMVLILNEGDIVWPGNVTMRPPGYIIPKHLKVVTIEEKPFIWTRSIHPAEECAKNEILCPKRNGTDGIVIVTGTYFHSTRNLMIARIDSAAFI